MSRLTDLIRQAKRANPQLGADLEREFKTLSGRLAFGLNFERHKPEAVELPQRPVRKGDKVRVLPERGSTKGGDQRLWRVTAIDRAGDRLAQLTLIADGDVELQTVPVENCVVVAEFRDPIYPGLVSTGKVIRGEKQPFHTVINGENFHVLEALTYTHTGAIDCIYIDPPYNSGAKDWKYNNSYVEKDDLYRHSKWLAFMERRLKIAEQLLRPEASVLIVSIDEKEYLRLGLLLEQTFPHARIQMVSTVINPSGAKRDGLFSRSDEYLYVVLFGDMSVIHPEGAGGEREVRWWYLRRTDVTSKRGTVKGGVSQFYPVFVDPEVGRIAAIGDPLDPEEPRSSVLDRQGLVTVFPVREDGLEMNWGLTGQSLKRLVDLGFVRVTKGHANQPYIFTYLSHNALEKITAGTWKVLGTRDDGSKVVVASQGKATRATTAWKAPSHDAGQYGTSTLNALLSYRPFPYPKSIYAVEDTLRFFLGNRPHASVLDFFAGSGTTAHAVMRLNRQDNGRRQSISVTNNEVSAGEQMALRTRGLRPGDPEWEEHGICEYITKPRIRAAITGTTPDGTSIDGEYKFNDEFPMSEGFTENAEFFTLTYETPISVSHNKSFKRIAPLLWMRAGSSGTRIDSVPEKGWAVADSYGILFDLDQSSAFCEAVMKSEYLRVAYVVTDDGRSFQSIARRVPSEIDVVRLYESYLSNFRINASE